MKLLLLALACALSICAQSTVTTFTALTAAGPTGSLDMRVLAPHKHTLQVVASGSPTTCTVRLEGSLDGANWADLSGTQTCTSVMFHVTEKPVLWVRGYLIQLAGGTSPAVTIKYLGVR